MEPLIEILKDIEDNPDYWTYDKFLDAIELLKERMVEAAEYLERWHEEESVPWDLDEGAVVALIELGKTWKESEK